MQLAPGSTVTITQRIPHGNAAWTTQTTGTVVSFGQRCTGSWYAHSKDDRLWLDRLTLRKPDGELTVLSLDEFSEIQVDAPPAAAGAEPAVAQAAGEEKAT